MYAYAIRIPEEELRRVAHHEAGHVVMGAIQKIFCHGVFIAYEPSDLRADGSLRGSKFCVPMGNKPPWTKPDYLQSAAGAGSEKLFFGGYNRAASEDDRVMFSTPGAPAWETTVDEAKDLMAGNEKIQFIAEAIISKCQNVPIQRWPDRGMNGSITRFKEILGVHEIAQRLEGTTNT